MCVTEDSVQQVTVDKSLVKPQKAKLKCRRCGKLYEKMYHFKRHENICKQNQAEFSNMVKEAKKPILSKQKKQKKSKATATVAATDHEFLEFGPTFLKTAVKLSRDDAINNIEITGIDTPGNKVCRLAGTLFKIFEKDSTLTQKISDDIIGDIAKIINEANLKIPSNREKMWVNILKIVKDPKECSLYIMLKDHLKDTESSIFSSFFQFICFDIVNSTIKFENERKRVALAPPSNLKISVEEEQVLYYVSGYVIYSLLKKYNNILRGKPKNKTAHTAVLFLNTLKVTQSESEELSGSTLKAYSNKWVKLVSRGYLIEVNGVFFMIIKSIETVARSILNIPYIERHHHDDLRDSLEQSISSNEIICNDWSSISRNLGNTELSEILKKQIISKWIDIRANSFVNAYIQVLKRKLNDIKANKKSKLSSSSEPALRKTLV